MDEEAVDASTYYLDIDEDGYGRSEPAVQACALPAGYVALAGDCNDDNAAFYPGNW